MEIYSKALPITLMHPVFAGFVETCINAKTSGESCEFAQKLCQVALGKYEKESLMASDLRTVLGQYLDMNLVTVTHKGSKTDGLCCVNSHLILNLEVKTHPGSTMSDPTMQNVAYFIKRNSVCLVWKRTIEF